MKGISMLLLCIIMMNLAVAIPTLNLNDTTEYTQSFDFPIIDLEINVSLQNVNSSDFWDALDTPADIDLTDLGTTNHNDLSNLDYASAAHTGFCSLDTYQVITGEKNFTGEVIFRGTSSPTDFKILEVLSGKALFTAHTEMGFGVDKLTRINIAGTDANSKFQVLDSSGNSPLTVGTVNNDIFFELGSSAESRLSFRYNATYFSSTIYAREVDPTPYIFNVGNGVKGSSGLGYSDYAQSFWVEFSEFNGLSLFADLIADDYRMEFFDWGAGIPTRPLKICNGGRGLYIQNCTDEKI